MRKQQEGMTFIGLVLMIAGIVFVAVIAMKLTPAYLEFLSIKKALAKIENDPSFASMSKNDIVSQFDRTAVIDDIRTIKGNELLISKEEGGRPVVTAEYQTVVPLVANVSALIDFRTSTDDATE
ncbi:MAG TPA: DUF4845 domain-containing protein [Methylophilaceae bacterium]|nr:DUF4845 domain-containing protein [Methylophilaceae bacterium]